MSTEGSVRGNIDMLRQLIKNVKSKGQYGNAEVYEAYLNKIMKNPKIKSLYGKSKSKHG